MKIKSIKAYHVVQPFVDGPYRMSKGRVADCFDAVIVAITSDSGVTGWGEMAPLGNFYSPAFAAGVRAGVVEIAPHLIGHDPRGLAGIASSGSISCRTKASTGSGSADATERSGSAAAGATILNDRSRLASRSGCGRCSPTPVARTAVQTTGKAYWRPRSRTGRTDNRIHTLFGFGRTRPLAAR